MKQFFQNLSGLEKYIKFKYVSGGYSCMNSEHYLHPRSQSWKRLCVILYTLQNPSSQVDVIQMLNHYEHKYILYRYLPDIHYY